MTMDTAHKSFVHVLTKERTDVHLTQLETSNFKELKEILLCHVYLHLTTGGKMSVLP